MAAFQRRVGVARDPEDPGAASGVLVLLVDLHVRTDVPHARGIGELLRPLAADLPQVILAG
jgi:hypothetical protein